MGLIEFYDFGVMVVNGKRYTSDLIVFPETVLSGWWRRKGHEVCVEDLREVFNKTPPPGSIGDWYRVFWACKSSTRS